MNNRIELLCAWSGFALVTILFLAYVPTGLVPVKPATTSAQDLAAYLGEHANALRIGMALQLFGGSTFLWTWCVGLAYQLKRTANAHPLLVYLMISMGAICGVAGIVFGVFGSLMVFRVGSVSPEITQMLYDTIWFVFLITWPPFTLWSLIVGMAILSDKSKKPIFPRWSGYLSLWAGLFEVPAALPVFFKAGPFSYNGVIAWWIPALSFFTWILAMTVLMIKAAYRNPENFEQEEKAGLAIL